ncbi:hypothetical protein BTVI_10891 [Pitangus sulphuratus]|nr:hypothetical protein BTVI_10891 [Pitangus sulphuratus]
MIILTVGTERWRSMAVYGAAAKWEQETLWHPEGKVLQSCILSQMRKAHDPFKPLAGLFIKCQGLPQEHQGNIELLTSLTLTEEQSTEKVLADAISLTAWSFVSAGAQLFVFLLSLMVPRKPRSPFGEEFESFEIHYCRVSCMARLRKPMK